MALAVSFTVLWWVCIGGLVLFWRKITTNLSEQRYIELISIFGLGFRPTKISEKIAPFFCLLAWGFFVEIILKLVFFLQKLAIGNYEGVLFFYDKSGLLMTSVVMIIPFWILLVLAASRYTKPLPAEKWKKHPMLWEMKQREHRLKYLFFAISILIQFSLYRNIYNYIIVDDEKLVLFSAFNQQETTQLEEAIAIFQYQQKTKEIDGVDTNVYEPSALLVINEENIELWNKLHSDRSKQVNQLIEFAKKLEKKNGELLVELPTLFEKGSLRKHNSEATFNEYNRLFNEVDLISNGISGQIEMGESATFDSLSIKVEDVSFSKSKPNSSLICNISLAITNLQSDTTNISDLLQFKLVNPRGHSTAPGLHNSNSIPGKIPNNETVKGDLSFTTNTRDSLVLEFKPNLFGTRLLHFKIY